MSDPQTADLVAKIAMRTKEPVRRRALLSLLARRLGGQWQSASGGPEIAKVIEQTLADREMSREGIALAAATRDRRYEKSLQSMAEDTKTPDETRVAAVEGLGAFPGSSEQILERLIESAQGKPSSNPIADAAVRTMAEMKKDGNRLIAFLPVGDYPLGLRREALRSLARLRDGGRQILDLASAGKLPTDLKNDATTLVHTDSNRRIREQAARVLPLPKTSAGRTLPPIGELVRRGGDPEKGAVCSSARGRTRARAAIAFKAEDSGWGPISPRLESSIGATS